MTNYSDLLIKKINAVTKTGKHVVRKVTDEEALEIESAREWENGYFMFENNQIVLQARKCGQKVIFRIG